MYKKFGKCGEMIQPLEAWTALPESWSSVPKPMSDSSQLPVSPATVAPDPSVATTDTAVLCTNKYTQVNIIKILKVKSYI